MRIRTQKTSHQKKKNYNKISESNRYSSTKFCVQKISPTKNDLQSKGSSIQFCLDQELFQFAQEKKIHLLNSNTLEWITLMEGIIVVLQSKEEKSGPQSD